VILGRYLVTTKLVTKTRLKFGVRITSNRKLMIRGRNSYNFAALVVVKRTQKDGVL
jgi:hypothetical protein